MTVSSCKCSQSKGKAQGVSWWSALFIAIIPKCPFCIMAYSSAITMCGGADMYVSESNWVSYVPLILALIIVAMIVLNFRDIRTYFALALSGAILVFLAHQTLLTSVYYNVGTSLLLLGIWVNGSFLCIVRKIFRVKYVQKT